MLKLVGKIMMKNTVFVYSQNYLNTRYLLTTKGKNSKFTVERNLADTPLIKYSKLISLVIMQIDNMYLIICFTEKDRASFL